MTELLKEKESYMEKMFFQLRITSRYLTLMGNKAFEKLNFPISFEEYVILDKIAVNEGICHRDLARMLLRDRSNIGKIVSGLEKKGLLKVTPDIRNNRAIKKMKINEKGIKLCNAMYVKLEPYMETLNKNINREEFEAVSSIMAKCKNVIDNIIETQI